MDAHHDREVALAKMAEQLRQRTDQMKRKPDAYAPKTGDDEMEQRFETLVGELDGAQNERDDIDGPGVERRCKMWMADHSWS